MRDERTRSPTAPCVGIAVAMLVAASGAWGQTSVLDATAPKPLPSPPALIHYTLESPTLLVLTLLGAAVLAYFMLNNAGKGRQATRAGVGLALVAAGIFGAALAIETPRERVVTMVKKLVKDTAEADTAALETDLADRVVLLMPNAPNGLSKARIINWVRANLGKNGTFGMQNFAVLEAQVDLPANSPAQVQVKVRVTGQAPTISWWRLDVAPSGDRWEVTGIKYLSSNVPFPGIS